jgi:hypothetical protein
MVLPQADRRSAVPAGEPRALSRQWRSASTHGGHDPVAWNYHRVSSCLLDCAPPDHGQI